MSLRYVALGDSYTIGTAVAARDRFPDQLVVALAGGKPPIALDLVANLGVDGYTSADLIRDELPQVAALGPEFATLCIGVNDVVQGVPLATYAVHAAAVLDALLAVLRPSRLLVVSVPDYTVTPAGGSYGEASARRRALEAMNARMAAIARDRGVAFIDIWDISREAASDRSLVADDGLHPSGRQYARWVERMVPVVRERLAG